MKEAESKEEKKANKKAEGQPKSLASQLDNIGNLWFLI